MMQRKIVYLTDFLDKKKGDCENVYISNPLENQNLVELIRQRIADIIEEKPTKSDTAQNENPHKLPILTARQLMSRKKDNRFIVERFLHPKTVNMLYSPPGTFKSVLTLDLCLSIAGGDPWLGMKTKKGRVLILDKENADSSLRDRLIGLVNGHGWKRKSNPRFLNLLIRQGSLDDPRFITELADYIKKNKVSLVVFDTIRRFGDYEENSSDAINRLYGSFQKIINGTDASILFLHHARKEGNTYRGSVDLLGQVDSCYRVERQAKTGNFKVVCEKSRSGEIDEINGEIEFLDEKIVIQRKDVDMSEPLDKYLKFKDTKHWVLRKVSTLCPMAGAVFTKASLMKLSDSENAEREKENRMSSRTIERVLFHLTDKKYVVKTGVYGEYKRLFSVENQIFMPQTG